MHSPEQGPRRDRRDHSPDGRAVQRTEPEQYRGRERSSVRVRHRHPSEQSEATHHRAYYRARESEAEGYGENASDPCHSGYVVRCLPSAANAR